MYTVRLSSEPFGSEEFHCETMNQALTAIRRIAREAFAMNDDVERIIGIIVNPRAEQGNDSLNSEIDLENDVCM